MATDPHAGHTNERLVFFTDAVIAIAITMLGLRLSVPIVETGDLRDALFNMWPRFEIYLISFTMIAYFWHLHHKMFKVIIRHDTALIVLNFMWLIFITLLPFATDILGRYHLSHTALLFYMSNMLAVGIVKIIMWIHAVNAHLTSRVVTKAYDHVAIIRSTVPIVTFSLAIILAFSHVHLSKYVLILVFIIPVIINYAFLSKKKHRV